MKRLLSFSLFAILSLLVSIYAQAQPVYTTIKTPNGPVSIKTGYHYYKFPTGNNNNNNKTGKVKSNTHTFTIILQNDSILTTKTSINLENFVHTLTYGKKESKIIIRPHETKAIYRLDKNGEEIMGMPHDSCWLFLAIKGKINAYSVTSDFSDPLLAYVQKGDGPLLAITTEILSELMADNEKALTILSRNNIDKAIRVYND